MIFGAEDPHAIGEILTKFTDPAGNICRQPVVVLREATFEEYLESIAGVEFEPGFEAWSRENHFYEVSTD